MTDLLTDAERATLAKTVDLWHDLIRVVGNGPTREADLDELVVHIHAIQRAVMANAAGRAYPEDFRRLGSTLRREVRQRKRPPDLDSQEVNRL